MIRTETAQTRNDRSPHPPSELPRGFTLVEVLFVLVLVGLMTGIVMPRVELGRTRANTTALQIGSRLMMSQRTAVVRQHDVRLLFDTGDRTIVVHHDEDNDGFFDGGEPVARRDLEEGVDFGQGDAPALPYGAGPVSFAEDPDAGMPVLTFHRNGSASQEGVIYLLPRGAPPAEDVRAVHVLRATGQVTCWSYRSGEWMENC